MKPVAVLAALCATSFAMPGILPHVFCSGSATVTVVISNGHTSTVTPTTTTATPTTTASSTSSDAATPTATTSSSSGICRRVEEAKCCATNAEGVMAVDCHHVSGGNPTSLKSFRKACAKQGLTANCCRADIAGTGLICDEM